jgi:uncharacterized protein (DUF58 family)
VSVAPTRRGVVVAVLGAVAIVMGWLFGLPEAAFTGVGSLALVGAAVALVATGGPLPEVRRAARPDRLAVGERCEVVLRLHNPARRRTAVTRLTDEVGEQTRAEVVVAPVASGAHAEAAYSLSTDRRGVQRLGPLSARIEDPFGLARRTTVAAGRSAVVVLPQRQPLDPLPAAVGDEPELGTHAMVASSTVDEEFTGLRGYVAGDDVRRIHWPSTARAASPVVRQFEVPWQHRTTLLLDLRSSRYDAAAFERAVVVAASVVSLCAKGGELLRMGTTVEPDPPFVPAASELDGLLDRLALVQPSSDAEGPRVDLVGAVERATRAATGRLVICTGGLPPEELARVTTAAARAGVALVVTTLDRADTADAAAARAAATGVRLDLPRPGVDPRGAAARVHWDGSGDLAVEWRRAGSTVAAGGVAVAGR